MHQRLRIQPNIYRTFNCTADACDLTCCRDWRIHVDPATRRRWKDLTLDQRPLLEHVCQESDGNTILRMDPQGKCAFLDTCGLCRLVLNYGDEALSDTCSLFPRQIRHEKDRSEYSLLPSCPEVMNLLKKNSVLTWHDAKDHSSLKVSAPQQIIDEDDRLTLPALRSVRESLICLVQTSGLTLRESLLVGFDLLLELWEQEPFPEKAANILNTLSSPEDCIRPTHEMDRLPTEYEDTTSPSELPDSLIASLSEVNELLLDLTQNYHREGHYSEFLPLLVHSSENFSIPNSTGWIEFEHFMDKYDSLLRQYTALEIYNAFLTDNKTLDACIEQFQWLILKLAVIRHSIYLLWDHAQTENRTLSWEELRTCCCILTRMTGYSQKDVHDTLRLLYDDPRWEWGYAALILGHFS